MLAIRAVASTGADAGDRIEPFARLVRSMPRDDHPVELQNLLFEPAQLSPQCGETGTGYRRNARVSWIGDDIEQRLDTLASDRRDDPELGKMSPDYIDHRCLLANEQMVCWFQPNENRGYPAKARLGLAAGLASPPHCPTNGRWCVGWLWGVPSLPGSLQSLRVGGLGVAIKSRSSSRWKMRLIIVATFVVGALFSVYLRVLHRVFVQANSLMFIDPYLDPSSHNYREFSQLLFPLGQRMIKPRIEIHRSFCQRDGQNRTFPTKAYWEARFAVLGENLRVLGLTADVFCWDDFHDRYLIADVVGIMVPGGFDITGKQNDLSTWGRLWT